MNTISYTVVIELVYFIRFCKEREYCLISSLILAAGNGKRMGIDYPKVLAKVLGVPMLSWVLDSIIECGIKSRCVVTGSYSGKLVEFLNHNKYECEICFQKERKGTAHAVWSAEKFIRNHLDDDILIVGGDAPFINSNIINRSYAYHKEQKNFVTVISSKVENPYGYGRIVRDKKGDVISIVEERDSNCDQKKIKEINSGAYWFNSKALIDEIGNIQKSSVSGEFYLTSIISIFIQNNLKVGAYCSDDSSIVLGANTPQELEILNNIAKSKLIKHLISTGVRFPYPESVFIGKNVEIGEGTTILADVSIEPFSKIGKNCIIGPKAVLCGSIVPDNTHLTFYNELMSPLYEDEKVKNLNYAT